MEEFNLNAILPQVKDCAIAAGRYFKQAAIERIDSKSSNSDLVTNVDKQTQQLIKLQLEKIAIPAEFIAEEQNNPELPMGYAWIVDPIDGTSNYIFHRHLSFVSIALAYRQQTVLACCYNPYRDDLFTAIKGQGAYLNGKQLHMETRPLEQSLLAIGTAPYDKTIAERNFECLCGLFKASLDLRRSGSCVADLCYLAANEHNAFYEACVSLWDYAAASLIVKEAGGEVHTNHDYLKLGKTYIMAGNSANFVNLKAICCRYLGD